MHIIKDAKVEIRIAGLQRNGNHAVINWIIRQSGPDVLFFNDVEPECPFDDPYLHSSSSSKNTDGRYDCVIYSYEDRLLDLICHKNYYPQKNIFNINAEKRIDVIILRNPFNAIASRMKHTTVSSYRSAYISGLNITQLWTTYAHEYLGHTRKLNNTKIVINYDLWCKSKDYRKKLASLLDLNFTDAGFNEIKTFGSGSSFDKINYNERANEMKTDQRWKYYSDNEEYKDLFKDKTLIKLTNEIFSPDKELAQFIDNILIKEQKWYSSLIYSLKIALLPKLFILARQSAIAKYIYFSFIAKKKV